MRPFHLLVRRRVVGHLRENAALDFLGNGVTCRRRRVGRAYVSTDGPGRAQHGHDPRSGCHGEGKRAFENTIRTSGNFFIDDELLARHGITDLEPYSVTPGTKNFIPDFFID